MTEKVSGSAQFSACVEVLPRCQLMVLVLLVIDCGDGTVGSEHGGNGATTGRFWW